MFSPAIETSIQDYLKDKDRPNRISIGIHSRHIRDNNDGSDVSYEMQCLDLILQKQQQQQQTNQENKNGPDGDDLPPCTVYVMADRAATLEHVKTESAKRNCATVTVDHRTILPAANSLYKQEHGPFAGGDFFRDWLVVSQAQTGFIHYKDRSSSALVYETMVYDGMAEGRIDSPVLRCSIDWRGGGALNLYDC